MIYVVTTKEDNIVRVMTEDIRVKNLVQTSLTESSPSLTVESFKIDSNFVDARWTIQEMKKYRLPAWTKPTTLADMYYKVEYDVTPQGLKRCYRHACAIDERNTGEPKIIVVCNDKIVGINLVMPFLSKEYEGLGETVKELNETVKFCANLGYTTLELGEAVFVAVSNEYGDVVVMEDPTV